MRSVSARLSGPLRGRWDLARNPAVWGPWMKAHEEDLKGTGQRETLLWSDAHAGLILKVDESAGVLRPVGTGKIVCSGGSVLVAATDDCADSLPDESTAATL